MEIKRIADEFIEENVKPDDQKLLRNIKIALKKDELAHLY